MEETVITSEIKTRCNPGLTTFGTGNIMTLSSQCLRYTPESTPCTICIDACPVNAIFENGKRLTVSTTSCLKCGACIGICPTNAISSSSRSVQQINRLALQSSLRVDRLAITCERTLALLRLQSETSDAAEEAEGSLKLIDKAVASDHLLKVPCLAMMTKELWFSLLNEVGVAKIEEAMVYLPLGQCSLCPVNTKDNIEELFGLAISTAEEWTRSEVGLVTTAEDLPQTRHANVRAYLVSSEEVDRRGLFTGFFKEIKDSWEEVGTSGTRALLEAKKQQERKSASEKTRLKQDRNIRSTGGTKKPLIASLRFIMVEALGRNPEHADTMVLTVSSTDAEKCTLCGTCVSVCPVRARKIVEDEVEPAKVEGPADVPVEQNAPVAEVGPDESDDKTDVAVDDRRGHVVCDPLYCVGCSACLQACPEGACYFIEITGEGFLLPQAQ